MGEVEPKWVDQLNAVYGGDNWRKLYSPSSQQSLFRVNRADAATLLPVFPSERVLIEMRGTWTHHEPMSGEDYRLVAGGD